MKRKIKHIGITGGIGSGKSFVCKIFESLSYQVYYADARAKSLMHRDVELVEGVKTLFGKEAYLPDGSLNRAYIGSIAFNDPPKLQKLNALVHPAVARDYVRWSEEIAGEYPHNFVLKEAAILFESGSYQFSDAVISVYAPKRLRIERVLQRETITKEAILSRMAKQWPESEKLKRADFCIFNDGSQLLLPQIRAAIQRFSA